MLEVVVGLMSSLLVLVGIAIIAGPSLLRSVGLARRRLRPIRVRRRRPRESSHPTTLRALAATARLMPILKEHGFERHAAALRMASRRLQVEEASGIRAMRDVLRHLRGLRLEDADDQKIVQGLVTQLQKAVDDRAEQLELLPGASRRSGAARPGSHPRRPTTLQGGKRKLADASSIISSPSITAPVCSTSVAAR